MHLTLEELFERNPAYAPLYAAVLSFCAEERTEAEAMAHVDAARSSTFQIQSSAAVLETLERRGALQRTVLVNGEPYEGTMRDVQEDESIEPDAQVECVLRTTPEGVAVMEAHAPDRQVAALFAEHPGFVGGFKAVLAMCEGEGRKTSEIQEDLRALGVFPCNPRTGEELVHASFFTGALEKCGALEWKGGRWVTTAAGATAAE